jgi:hypothetical protein
MKLKNLIGLLSIAHSQTIQINDSITISGSNNNFIGIKYATAARFMSPIEYAFSGDAIQFGPR